MFPFKTVNDGRRLHVDPSADPVVDPAFQRCPDHPQCQHRASTLCPFAHNVGVSRRNEDMVRAFYAAELEKQHGKHAGVEDRVPDVDSLSAAKKTAVVEASSASSASASLASSSSSSTNKRKTADNRLEKVEANKSEAVSAENRQEVEHGISSKAKRQRHVTANPALQQANANATTQSATLELREPRATKIAIKLRRATLTAIGKLFTEMYASIADTEKNAAIIDAIRQEWELHEASTSRSYQSNAASVLVALRKRMREADTGESDAVAIRGTMGQYERALEERRLQQESDFPLAALLPHKLTQNQLIELDFPRPLDVSLPPLDPGADPIVKECDRCGERYPLRPPHRLSDDERTQCSYHWGRLRPTDGDVRFGCCNGARDSGGCVQGPHVYLYENVVDCQRRFAFVQWKRATAEDSCAETVTSSTHDILAIDCEMVYTTLGMELARVTAVDKHERIVLDTFVDTSGPVIDFNTRWSGITANLYATTSRLSLAAVQYALFALMHAETILVGHSLNSDLKALRIMHDHVIDTVMLFPHHRGLPFRHALRYLAKVHLQRFIQEGSGGHDSVEDACAAMSLVRTFVRLESRRSLGGEPVESSSDSDDDYDEQ